MKLYEKYEAIRLRKLGLSYSSIRRKLKISKSTLSLWLRDIELDPKQKKKILVGLEKSRAAGAMKKRADRQRRTMVVRNQAKKEFVSLRKNPLFLVGLSLYAAEGDKNALERVKFANSDPSLVVLMMRWFREICLVSESRFRVALHIHNLHSNRFVTSFWVKKTGVPKSQFYKLYIKQSTLGYRKNVLYNGTCSVIISSKDLFRKIMTWKQMLFESFEVN
ncbi:MAG: hypothetical protein Q8O75_00015 [bacterium]|nr:hypothetical protein [bacterium]